MSAPVQSPIVDLKTGHISDPWLNYFDSLEGGGALAGFTNVTVNRNFSGTGGGTLEVSVDAARLTGTTLAANVVASSLTSVGTLTGGRTGAGFVVDLARATVTGTLPYAALPSGTGIWVSNPTIQGQLTVNGGILVLDDILPQVNYRSNLGSIASKFLTVHAAELWVETLVAQDVMATIGGRIVVAPTTYLTADLAPAATTITVKHNNLQNGDRVRFEGDGKVEWMAITSVAGGTAGLYTYTVTRNLDGSGANQWYIGDAALDTGTTGDGFLELYSTTGMFSGSGPTIVGNIRTGTTYSDIATRWAIGNLNGLYGYVTDTYGAAFGDPSGSWVKIDATNGVRLGYNTTTYGELDATGLSFGGVLLNDDGLFINPANASGGGAYTNDHAVRWTTDPTYRTAIWRSDDSTAFIKDWNFDNVQALASTVWARTYLSTVLDSGSYASYAVLRQWSRDGRAENLLSTQSTLFGSQQSYLWMWAGQNVGEQQVVLGVGAFTQSPSGGPPTTALTTGFNINFLNVYFYGGLRQSNSGSSEFGEVRELGTHQFAVSQNLSYTGTYDLGNTAKSGWMFRLVSTDDGDYGEVLRASAGANPRTPVSKFRVYASGSFSVGTVVDAAAAAVLLPNAAYFSSVNAAGSGVLGMLKLNASNETTLECNSAYLSLATAATQSTVGAAGGASALPATPLGYLLVRVNGAGVVIPYYNQ